MAGAELLYLFSSDQAGRYAQDVVDVLGAPRGRHFRFRYDERHVEQATRQAIADDQLKGRRALVVFASQHPAMYAPAAFVPIRFARVIKTERIGTHDFIDFAVENLVSLHRHGKPEGRQQEVLEFTKALSQRTKVPYEAWASLGSPFVWASVDPSVLEAGADEDVYFETAAEYLAAVTAFSSIRFMRFLRCSLPGGTSPQVELRDDPSAIELQSGKTYQLELLQFIPKGGPVSGGFSIQTDDSAVLIQGEPRIRISSRYDKPVVRIKARPLSQPATVETSIVVEPEVGTDGPRIEIPVRITLSRGSAIAQTAATTVALLALALPTILTDWSYVGRVLLAIAGAAFASYFQVVNWGLPKMPTLPKDSHPAAVATSPQGSPSGPAQHPTP